jgi:hypothetical protein
VTRCYVHSLVQAHEAEPRRRHLGLGDGQSVGHEASLLKPATQTGTLAIFMTQGKKEGASSSGARSLEASLIS